MAGTLSMGAMFPEELVKDLFTKVKGKSSLAALCKREPISFTGTDLFVFSMDDEVNLVGENGKHAAGNIKISPVKMHPLKIEYGARISEEFMIASEERQIELLSSFNDGFEKKLARGLDIMGMHGINPRTGTTSELITQSLDKGTQKVDYAAATADENIEAAVQLLGDHDITGLVLSKIMASDMAKLEGKNGAKKFPELEWGGQPKVLKGIPTSINSTVSYGTGTKTRAVVGDFESAFRWGYTKKVPIEIIPYGDPDNTGVDLKGSGQIYIRAQAYIGFGILDETAFARVDATA